jgi:hypothetical protein
VISANDFGAGEIYIQSGTEGIQVRDFVVDSVIDQLEVNDELLAAGFASLFNGKAQLDDDAVTGAFDPVTIELFDETGAIVSQLITLSQLGETTENTLVEVVSVTMDPAGDTLFNETAGFSTNYDVTDTSGMAIMRIDDDTDVDGTPIPPTNSFDSVIGVAGQFNGGTPLTGYQILPRSTGDLTGTVLTGVVSFELYR